MSFSITLSKEVAARVAEGRPIIGIEELQNTDGLEPGRPVRLLDSQGRDAVASGLADPENEIIRVLSRDPNAKFDAAFFRRRVEAAVALRRELGLIGTTSCRVIHSEGDWLSGFTSDLFCGADGTPDFAVLYVYSRALVEHGRLVAQSLLEVLKLRGVVLKVRPKGGAASGQVKQEIIGETPEEKRIGVESGVPYEIHLLGGMNVGLFTDMREHRRGLHRFAAGRRVLNCFSYTGAISVTAAKAGAKSVTSVDLSSGVLKWAAENFRLSGFSPDSPKYKFEVSDVGRFLERTGETDDKYDLVILDPPTFSKARASGWSIHNDYGDLIASAIQVLSPGGILWISANTVREQRLGKYLDEGLKQAGKSAQILELGGLPPDYPTLPGYPEGRYLEVCLSRIASGR